MPSERESTEGNAETSRGVLCVECEHLNPPGEPVCHECGAHLFIVCAVCGLRNERIYTRCQGCKRPLHRSRWSRWIEKLFGKISLSAFVILGMEPLNFSGLFNVSQAVTERALPFC